jgi:hypothetical protein
MRTATEERAIQTPPLKTSTKGQQHAGLLGKGAKTVSRAAGSSESKNIRTRNIFQ